MSKNSMSKNSNDVLNLHEAADDVLNLHEAAEYTGIADTELEFLSRNGLLSPEVGTSGANLRFSRANLDLLNAAGSGPVSCT